jgi:hypothetical protein
VTVVAQWRPSPSGAKLLILKGWQGVFHEAWGVEPLEHASTEGTAPENKNAGEGGGGVDTLHRRRSFMCAWCDELVAIVIHLQALAVKESKCTEDSVRSGCEDHKFYKIKTIEFKNVQCTLWWHKAIAAHGDLMVITRQSSGSCIHTALRKFCFSLLTVLSIFHHVCMTLQFIIPKYDFRSYLGTWESGGVLRGQNSVMRICIEKRCHRLFLTLNYFFNILRGR